MQTFVPEKTFELCAKRLDQRRLNKQIAECGQIAGALKPDAKGWKNHPAALMWKGYENALIAYRNACLEEWVARGYNSTRDVWPLNEGPIVMPHWWGGNIHITHQSNLLRKDPMFYGQWNWTLPNGNPVPPNLEYYWPRRSKGGVYTEFPEPSLEELV